MFLTSIEYLLVFILSVNIIYLLIFSIASHCSPKNQEIRVNVLNRIVILIPAYKEDQDIME